MDNRPNIIFIYTDQQNTSMMSCAGNENLKTPAIDSIANSGVRFERAYCASPVCCPSRFSLMTGMMPSEIGLRSNDMIDLPPLPESIIENGLGKVFKNHGYDAAYGGVVHFPGFRPEDIGFDFISADQRDILADDCVDYILEDRDKPFFLTASFINPHDICYMAIKEFQFSEECKNIVAHGKTEVETLDIALALAEDLDLDELPPLPENHEPQKDEPEAIKYLQELRSFKKMAREQFTERQWRLHRWAYARLTELVDAQISKLLDALKESGKDKNTIVIFSADHGDFDSAHKMEHKTALYEEGCRIPMLISTPELKDRGFTDKNNLISNGLDLIPTICDFADIPKPTGLKGKSLKPLVERTSKNSLRSVLPVEGSVGNMIVTDKYKYMLYDKGANREQLIDLEKNPGEMYNDALLPENKDILQQHRDLYKEFYSS